MNRAIIPALLMACAGLTYVAIGDVHLLAGGCDVPYPWSGA